MAHSVNSLLTFLEDKGLDGREERETRLLRRAMQQAMDRLLLEYEWSFLLTRDNLNSSKVEETGTIALAHGASAITGTGTTFVAADTGRRISFANEGTSFKLGTFTSGTEIALAQAYLNTAAANLSGVSFALYRNLLTLANGSLLDRVLSLQDRWNHFELRQVDIKTLAALWEKQPQIGVPQVFAVIPDEANRSASIELYPCPQEQRPYTLIYQRRLALVPAAGAGEDANALDWPGEDRLLADAVFYEAAMMRPWQEHLGVASALYQKSMDTVIARQSKNQGNYRLSKPDTKVSGHRFVLQDSSAVNP